MTDTLVVVLVAVVAGAIGGVAGAIAGAVTWTKKNNDFDAALDDFHDRLLTWQRKVTKRERDARGSARAGDPEPDGVSTFGSRNEAILARARARGIPTRPGA